MLPDIDTAREAYRIDKTARQLLTRVVNDKVTENDKDLWLQEGHLILHWLREKLQKEWY